MADQCPFCELMKNHRVEWDSYACCHFTPLNPVTPGHLLFVPSLHTPDAAYLPGITAHVFEAAARHGRKTREQFNLITSVGPYATQSVYHLHVHYVPRTESDGLVLPWTA